MKTTKALKHLAFGAVSLLIGGFFLLDSLSYGLAPADPATGRAKGCYTAIESWLGYLEPNDSIRIGQTFISLGVVVVALWLLVRTLVIYAVAKSRPSALN